MEHQKVGSLLVYLKTSEEAVCKDGQECKYSFTNVLPNITAIAPEWDTTTLAWNIKISGTSFTGDASSSMLTVGGIEQPAVAVLPSTAVFKVTNAPTSVLKAVRLFLDIGIPDGDRTLLDEGVVMTPKFVGISSSKGSKGGSNIVLNVQGVGSQETVHDIKYTNSDGASTSLCKNHSVISYGKIECQTFNVAIPADTPIEIFMTATSTAEVCASGVNATCNYEATDVGMPVITNASIASAGTIQFTGTDFISTGFTP